MSMKERKRLILQRSCKLLVHELSHLLGVDHCVFYDCCMNGSGHLEEDFSGSIYRWKCCFVWPCMCRAVNAPLSR
eukprot:m.21161 g.21161  ORF g.21161 m.21161 type:complete len:75 (+) comp28147_c0_seq1:1433-1657(+)